MSIYGMMRTSISGMHAQSNRLSAVADNIANSDTNGYRRANILFSTLVAGSSMAGGVSGTNGTYNSGSVLSHTTRAFSQQGAIQYTSSASDLAISGEGYFVVQDASGQIFLTRSGSFLPNASGQLVNQDGFALLGQPIYEGSSPSVANGLTDLEIITLNSFELSAVASSSGILTANLASESNIVTGNMPSSNAADAQFTNKISLITYDNLGAEKIVDVYYTKTAENTWEVSVYDGSEADATTGGFPYASGALSTDTMTFDPLTGRLDATSVSSLSFNIPGGSAINLDMSGFTQLATDFAVTTADINGRSPSSVVSVSIGSDGVVYGHYNDESHRELFQITLGTVANPSALEAQTGTVFSTTAESGAILIGNPQQTGFGEIISSAVELSNVDIAEELTNMIQAQRGFTANSKVFQTGSDLMDVVVNLKR